MGRSVRGSVECYHSLKPFLEVPTFVWLRRSKLNNKVVLTLEAPPAAAAPSTPRPPPQIAFHGLKVAEKGLPFAEEARLALISHGV